MSEKAPFSPEQQPTPAETQEAPRPPIEELETKDVSHDHSIDKIKESIHNEAISAKETTVGEHRTDTPQATFGMQHIKTDAYVKMLKGVRGQLNPAEKALSKTVHQPFIEAASEIGSKTIARPSGILGGGLIALVGSAIVLYISKHYGLPYNFFVFLLLFGAGFLTGIFAEVLIKLVKRR